MTVATHKPVDAPSPSMDSTERARRVLLRANGGFLAVVGAVQVGFELMSHYTGGGVYGGIFEHSPYSIGWVENHGLALLIGLLYLTVAARDGRRFWHVFALTVHLFLGTANVVFWSAFVTFDMTTPGVLATAAHVAFVVAHGLSLRVSRRPT
jgi:hypothetical protein